MPMPTKHRKQATALAKLTQDISRFLKSARFLAALDEFHDNPDARKAASKNAPSYLKQRGVAIPKGMKVTLKDNNWSVKLCAKAFIFEVCITYDSVGGFRTA
ncbi:MAG TPA: hypothetical protein VJU86_01855 [Pyrinomonadaceae bacterium]|nr:hypothetical protein [Pyrinomonadaceae bacterium]